MSTTDGKQYVFKEYKKLGLREIPKQWLGGSVLLEVDLEKKVDKCRHHIGAFPGGRISLGAIEGESSLWSFIKVKV